MFATAKGEPLRHKGAIIVESTPYELVGAFKELHVDDEDVDIVFQTCPLYAFLARDEEKLWFRGREHDIKDTLARNPALLAKFISGEDYKP
jgi:RecB family endonuclease NucS